jgi:hypothetical protein
MIVFLYRPSPQVPEPSEEAAERCFDASVRNIRMQSNQIAAKSVDLTWIFAQTLFMSLNTILWSLSYPSIRQHYPIDEVKICLKTALKAIHHTSERWPGVQSALQLYQNLIQGCLKAYSDDASYVVRTPQAASDEASLSPCALSHSPASAPPLSLTNSHTPQSHWEAEASGDSLVESRSSDSTPPDQTDYFADAGKHDDMDQQGTETKTEEDDESPFMQLSLQQSSPLPAQQDEPEMQSGLPFRQNYGIPSFNPNSVNNMFPATIPGLQNWDSNQTAASGQAAFAGYNDVVMDTKPWLGDFGDEYSRYMHQDYNPPRQRMESLSEQQQHELMAALEQDQLPDVSQLISDAETFYDGNIL